VAVAQVAHDVILLALARFSAQDFDASSRRVGKSWRLAGFAGSLALAAGFFGLWSFRFGTRFDPFGEGFPFAGRRPGFNGRDGQDFTGKSLAAKFERFRFDLGSAFAWAALDQPNNLVTDGQRGFAFVTHVNLVVINGIRRIVTARHLDADYRFALRFQGVDLNFERRRNHAGDLVAQLLNAISHVFNADWQGCRV